MAAGETAMFLDALFGRKPAHLYVCIWTLPFKRSRFFRDLGDAAAYCAELHCDVYVGVGLYERDLGAKERGKASDVAGLVGLWADVDIAGGAHKDSRKTYPPDEASARGLVAQMPRAVSLLVHSGHGLQAWWTFTRPVVFATAVDRQRWAARARGWQAELARRAGRMGWDVDSTTDLSRVLRVAGTTNYKEQDAPVPVRVLG